MDTHNINLDDISKTTFCIPFKPVKRSDSGQARQPLIPKSYADDRDLEDGRELRFAAYKSAWNKCLSRMQNIVRNLQNELVKEVIHQVDTSHSSAFTLPGLPYPEIPVVSLINPGLGSTLLQNITLRLEGKSVEDDDEGERVKCFVTHIYPSDVPNLITGLRTIIAGLVEKDTLELQSVRRKPTSSLASYDIKYLVAWYKAWVHTHIHQDERPNIVILLHDFEQFDAHIMRDVFDIFSKHIHEIPIVFLLSMTSPLSNYLNLTYPQSTLALLRVRTFSAPTGTAILEDLLLKTFFDVDFHPTIVLGPPILKYLHDYFTRYTPSIDALFTLLQVAFLRHFTNEPLSVLVSTTPSPDTLASASAEPFVAALRARIQALIDANSDSSISDIDVDDEAQLVNFVNEARADFAQRHADIKLGVNVVLLVNGFLRGEGYNAARWTGGDVLGTSRGGRGGDEVWEAIMGVFDKDRVGRVVKELGLITRRLNRREMKSVLDSIYQYINELPVELSSTAEEQEAKMRTIELRDKLARSESSDSDEMLAEVGRGVSTWLGAYLRQKLRPLEECALWDVWYTGLAPFPSELVNPSVRASVIAGLVDPHSFTVPIHRTPSTTSNDDKGKRKSTAKKVSDNANARDHALHDLPDSSILFARYLDSGRMINAWDWFEAFKLVLDEQRDVARERAAAAVEVEGDGEVDTASPRKRGAKAKGKGRSKSRSKNATEKETGNEKGKGKEGVFEVEEDEERWAVQVQARFVRALHELDYFGFIRHTGRKADHLVRTVFEVDDAH